MSPGMGEAASGAVEAALNAALHHHGGAQAHPHTEDQQFPAREGAVEKQGPRVGVDIAVDDGRVVERFLDHRLERDIGPIQRTAVPHQAAGLVHDAGECHPDADEPRRHATNASVAESLTPAANTPSRPSSRRPDPRFTLANERTFLAWIRTSLALLAGGIAIEAFTSDVFVEPVRKGLAAVLLLLGMMLSAGSAVRWLRVERCMRNKAPLPLPLIVPLLATGGALASAIVLTFVLAR
jgi:putative membrane protein